MKKKIIFEAKIKKSSRTYYLEQNRHTYLLTPLRSKLAEELDLKSGETAKITVEVTKRTKK